MTAPLNLPIVPGNLTQRITGAFQRTGFSFSVPITDDSDVPYAPSDVTNVLFGMSDRSRAYGPQASLGSGIAVSTNEQGTFALVTVTDEQMAVAPGEWRFLAKFLVAGTWLPLCGGTIDVWFSPIRPPV